MSGVVTTTTHTSGVLWDLHSVEVVAAEAMSCRYLYEGILFLCLDGIVFVYLCF
jgi:hypothetical protein